MEIKSIENFTSQDCENFLKSNPNSKLVEAVKARQKQLMDESQRSNKREEKARKEAIHSYETKTRWVDMAQFNERKKYKNLSTFRGIIIGTICVCAFIVVAVIYYCNTGHYMYSVYNREQASYVSGIESFLLKIYAITVHSYEDCPRWNSYEFGDAPTFALCIALCIIALLILLFTNIFHSPLVGKIYNIQDGDKSQKYRIIQNKNRKMGLCKVGRVKIKKILAFDYDNIYMISDNCYICKKDGKFGIYSAEIQKMNVPMIYEEVYAINEDSVDLVKGGNVYRFTHNGYRIIE